MFVWNAYRGRGGWRGRKRKGRPGRAERERRPGGGLGGSGASASGNGGGIQPRPGQLSVGGAPACPAPRALRRGVETAPRESDRKFTLFVFLLLFRCRNADVLDEKHGMPNFLDQPFCTNLFLLITAVYSPFIKECCFALYAFNMFKFCISIFLQRLLNIKCLNFCEIFGRHRNQEEVSFSKKNQEDVRGRHRNQEEVSFKKTERGQG